MREGRLVWGVNDFDEACKMPYAIDLVRLATSALLAGRGAALRIGGAEACAAILEGYTQHIASGGKPFVLEEAHPALRRMALGAERDPVRFWARMSSLPDCEKAPKKVRTLLASHLPDRDLPFRMATRIAGLGSLGRQRIVAIASWHDGMVAREAKAMLPSAYGWATGAASKAVHYMDVAGRAVRCPDPCLALSGRWLVRRLAPHCSRNRDRAISEIARRGAAACMRWARDREHPSRHAQIDGLRRSRSAAARAPGGCTMPPNSWRTPPSPIGRRGAAMRPPPATADRGRR